MSARLGVARFKDKYHARRTTYEAAPPSEAQDSITILWQASARLVKDGVSA